MHSMCWMCWNRPKKGKKKKQRKKKWREKRGKKWWITYPAHLVQTVTIRNRWCPTPNGYKWIRSMEIKQYHLQIIDTWACVIFPCHRRYVGFARRLRIIICAGTKRRTNEFPKLHLHQATWQVWRHRFDRNRVCNKTIRSMYTRHQL